MVKKRLDLVLTERGLAESRSRAQSLIMEGLVTAGGRRDLKAGSLVDEEIDLQVEQPLPYVGRGALKLETALDGFGIDPNGRTALDIGSSTGGFTDLLLQRGASRVIDVDVTISQLHYRLMKDPRVLKVEKNARYLEKEDLQGLVPSLVVMDLSFISVLKVLPAVKPLAPKADYLVLVKPQFEGRREWLHKGIVRDAGHREEILLGTAEGVKSLGLFLKGVLPSTSKGQKGNQEYLFYMVDGGEGTPVSEERLREVAK